MSYDIVKRIRIQDNKVLITCASNNVYPHTFEEWESNSLSKILQEQGQEALDIELLRTYESGCFQGVGNKYTRALEILRHLPEYKEFNWRLGGTGEEYDRINKNRATEAFNELLKRCFSLKPPKDKFIISKPYNGNSVYLLKTTRRSAKFCWEKAKAKIFKYIEDTERLKNCFQNTEDWKTEQL